jgi:flavodoxin I
MLHVCFATMTGNAESLANRAHDRAVASGLESTLVNLANARPADLAGWKQALFVVSTWGDGEPPADACDFWYDLEKADLALSGLRFAVLGLGDRDYQNYNAFARLLDERLAALGATRLLDRAEADLDFEDAYVVWENEIVPAVASTVAA